MPSIQDIMVQNSGRSQANSGIAAVNPIYGVQQGERAQRTRYSIQTQTTYVLQQATQDYARSIRGTAATKAYQTELAQGTYRESAQHGYVVRLNTLMRDTRQTKAGEYGFIQGHLDKLNEARQKFLDSEEHHKLPSIYDIPRKEGTRLESVPQETQADSKQAEQDIDRSEDRRQLDIKGTERARNTARSDAAEKEVKPAFSTSSVPDPSAMAFVGANLIK